MPIPEKGVAPGKVHLSVRVADESAELAVFDGNLQLVTRKTGDLQVDLTPGLYKVQARLGLAAHEEVLALGPERAEREVSFPPLRFASPIPLRETDLTTAEERVAAAEQSRRVHVGAGKGSWLYVFVRPWGRARGKPGRPGAGNSARGLKLLNAQGDVIVALESASASEEKPAVWAACNLEVDPGAYRLRMESVLGRSQEQALFACSGWQTQVFLLHDSSEVPSELQGANRTEVAIAMVPGCGFDPDDPKARRTEVARLKLGAPRGPLSQGLRAVASGTFDDPLLGLYTAHLLHERGELEPAALTRIVDRLGALLGRNPPDVALLSLLEKAAPAPPLTALPLLYRSWLLLLNAAERRFPTQPSMQRVLATAHAAGPYLRWKPRMDFPATPRALAELILTAMSPNVLGSAPDALKRFEQEVTRYCFILRLETVGGLRRCKQFFCEKVAELMADGILPHLDVGPHEAVAASIALFARVGYIPRTNVEQLEREFAEIIQEIPSDLRSKGKPEGWRRVKTRTGHRFGDLLTRCYVANWN
jgi:hypothetical protein